MLSDGWKDGCGLERRMDVLVLSAEPHGDDGRARLPWFAFILVRQTVRYSNCFLTTLVIHCIFNPPRRDTRY